MKSIKLIAFLVLVLSIAACGSAPATAEATPIPTVIADNTIIAEGHLEPIHYTELGLNASGLVSEVLFKEGNTVAAGDVIARLEASEAQTLESAQAKTAQGLTAAYQGVRDAQLKFDNFEVPNDFKDLTPSEAVTQTLTALNKARENYEPYRYLGDNNGSRKEFKKRLDDAWADYRKAIQWFEIKSNLQTAEAHLVQAQRDYDSLNDPSFSADTAGARAALANAEVRAPFPGIITDLNLKVGEFAASGQPVVTIADNSQWVVKTTDLTEIDVVNITEGQSVTITLDALPGVELRGNVLFISHDFSENQGDVVYEVTVLLTDLDPAMRWGMTAVVKFAE